MSSVMALRPRLGLNSPSLFPGSLAAPCSYGLSVIGLVPLYRCNRSLLFTLDLKTKGLKCPLPYLQSVTLNFTTCSFKGAWARKNYK